jgi:beta-glucosidase
MSTTGFPDGFMWGAATSSVAAEGAAPRSDWFAWEEAGLAPRSGDGDGFVAEHASDLRQLAGLGLTHLRLTLDWARLEPRQGHHDGDAIERYREILTTARDVGIHVWACLHDVDLPGWFVDDEGGFLDRTGRSLHWARHVDRVGETFGDLVHGWIPIHQPVGWSVRGWLTGTRPPGRRDPARFAEALEAVLLANHEAWRLLRSGDGPTCTSHGVMPVHAVWDDGDEREADPARANARLLDDVVWRTWTRALVDGVLSVPGRAEIEVPEMAGSFDLVGFSYDAPLGVGPDLTFRPYPPGAPVGPTGLAPWAEGLRTCLDRLADALAGRALVVTGIGFTTPAERDDDEARCRYLDDCLGIVRDAIADGVDVRGVLHRRAVDGYEWELGTDVADGLIRRDRTAKASAELARRWALGD